MLRTPLNRFARSLILSLLAATAGAGFLATTTAAHAAAPMVKKICPGLLPLDGGRF